MRTRKREDKGLSDLEQEHRAIGTHDGDGVLSVGQYTHGGKVLGDNLQILQSTSVTSGEGGRTGSEAAAFPEVGLDTETVQEQANIEAEEVEERMMERLARRALHLLVPELLPLRQLHVAVAQENIVVYVRLK